MGVDNNFLNSESSFSGKRVLVVDDEDCIVYLFRTILEMEFSDIEVDVAHNGQQAVESFRTNHHELVLMDLHMPVMDGFSAYSEINELCDSEECNMPPVIFCTGFAPSDRMKSVLDENPCNGYLPKPISAAELIGAIKTSMKI